MRHLAPAVALLAACAPGAGECLVDADCPSLTSCSDGLCVEVGAARPDTAADAPGAVLGERAPLDDVAERGVDERGTVAAEAEPVVDDTAVGGSDIIFLDDRCTAFTAAGRDFVVCEDRTTHATAVERCASLGLALASIHSVFEMAIVTAQLELRDASNRTWMGLDESSGTPRWLDGSPMDFTAFAGGVSVGHQAHEHCGVIEDGVWQDDDCTGRFFSRVCASAP